MAVYVDSMRANYGHMKMCHMLADSTVELLGMAKAIGVNHKWIQKPGTTHEHFDICLNKRKMAVAHGAIEISLREVGRILKNRRSFDGNKKTSNNKSNRETITGG
jgi:hypothetical protein